MTNKSELKIFLCHGSEDKALVRQIHSKLSMEGYSPWLDEKELLPGQDWNSEIRKAVRDSDVILVCLSQHSIGKSGYVQKEIKFALDIADEKPFDSIFIIPVRLDTCDIPERLSKWQWVQYSDNDGYSSLIRSLDICVLNKNQNTSKKVLEETDPCIIAFTYIHLSRGPERYLCIVRIDDQPFIEITSPYGQNPVKRPLKPGTHSIEVEYDILYPSTPGNGRTSSGYTKYIAKGKTERQLIDFKSGIYEISLDSKDSRVSFWDVFTQKPTVDSFRLVIKFEKFGR